MGFLLNGGAQDGGGICSGLVFVLGRLESLNNNGGAQSGREIALVGVVSVVGRKTDDREEIRRQKAKDGKQSMEGSLKQKLLN